MSLGKDHPLLKTFQWNSKIQCQECGSYFLFNEHRTVEDYTEQAARKNSYKKGDLICPKCDAIHITADDVKHYVENGTWPEGSNLNDGKEFTFRSRA